MVKNDLNKNYWERKRDEISKEAKVQTGRTAESRRLGRSLCWLEANKFLAIAWNERMGILSPHDYLHQW